MLPARRIFILLTALTGLLSAAERPNVILIVIDDPGYADFTTGKDRPRDVVAPHLDELAARSTRYSNGYVTAPICNASRLALLTGRYQQRLGTHWYDGPGIEGSKVPTVAETFRKAGYRTGMVGKVHHGSNDRAGNRNHPLNHGYDSFFGFLHSTKHYLKHARKHDGAGLGPLSAGPMLRDREEVDVEGFATELFGSEAVRFVESNRQRPFFLHLSFSAVHNYTPQLPPDYLAAKGIPPYPEYDPAKGSINEWRANLSFPKNPHGRAYYLGQLHFLDLEIGRLLTALHTNGMDDRTAIFLIGDNGGSLVTYAENAPLKGGKYTLFEGGVKVPFWIRWPGGHHGGTNPKLVSALDLLPTFAGLSGQAVPEGADGVDLRKPFGERELFWDTGAEQAVRSGNWKWLRTCRAPNRTLQIIPTPAGEYLYNLDSDPGETKNVLKEHPEIAARLAAGHETWTSQLAEP